MINTLQIVKWAINLGRHNSYKSRQSLMTASPLDDLNSLVTINSGSLLLPANKIVQVASLVRSN